MIKNQNYRTLLMIKDEFIDDLKIQCSNEWTSERELAQRMHIMRRNGCSQCSDRSMWKNEHGWWGK